MKFRLSNLLLFVTLIAVCVAWITDRRKLSSELLQLKESRAQRDEQIYTGSTTMARSAGKLSVFNRFDFDDLDNEFAHIRNDPKYKQVLIEECVTSLLDVFKNQKEIKIVGTMIIGKYDARLDARESLYLLECDSADQFFEIAKSLKSFANPDWYPKLHDTNSDEFKLFHKFISDTIAIKDQFYDGKFENDPREK